MCLRPMQSLLLSTDYIDTIDYTDYIYTSIYRAGTLYVVFTRYSGTKSYCMIAGVSCHLSLTGSSGHGGI